MKEDRRDDLVSTTAIVAGAVVGIAATVVSLWLSAEETTAPMAPVQLEDPSALFGESGAGVIVVPLTATGEAWSDPRGPERGPDEIEWEVISTYKTIESMTSAEPGDEAVDRALVELWSYAKEYPSNPFIQEIQLKGLRVAQYWAFQGGDLLRASLLSSRFENEASESMMHDLTVRESMRMLAQRIGQRCENAADDVQELRRLSLYFPNEHSAEVLRSGVDAAMACVEDSSNQ